MTKKQIVWTSVLVVFIVGGIFSYFKWGKPYMDKKREEKRLAETSVVTKSQSNPVTENSEAVNVLLEDKSELPLGFGMSQSN